ERQEEKKLEVAIAAYTAEAEATRGGDGTRQLAPVRQKLDRARADYDAFRRRLLLAHPQLETERASFAPATLVALNAGLFARDPDLCVLSYSEHDKHAMVFVLTAGPLADGPATLTVHRLTGLGDEQENGELVQVIEKFRAGCQNPNSDVSAEGQRLYR